MAKSTNINNRRYLGNKYKLLPFIKKVVDSECTDIEIVVDIFSGTGAVASAFQDKQLITNDIMYSNYISNLAWFSPRKYSRKKIEKIPEAAFREAIANGLIHRIWDVESQIRVLMFEDRIEVVSPGGLPAGITKEEYLSGKLSVLRNRNLANVFYRLGFVEIFGTGIMRIRQLYEKSLRKPEFEVSENAIQIVLPVWESNLDLTEDEKMIYGILSKNRLKSMGEIAPYVSFGRSKTTKLLKEMEEKGNGWWQIHFLQE